MIIRRKEEMIERVREDGVKMTDFFGEVCPTDGRVSMGCAVFPPGTVVPPAAHTGDEYGFILSGRMKCESNGVVNEFEAGEASFIPAGETHSSRSDSGEEATVLWLLIEK